MFEIEIKDKLGTHVLESDRDCIWRCPYCKHEKKVTRKNLDKHNKLVNPECPNCKESLMEFRYWLDCMD